MRQADKRYFGIDMHKHYVVLAAVDGQQEVVVKPRKLHWSEFESWVKENLTGADEAVIEAMAGAWQTHDQLAEHAGRVVVAHPYHVKLVAASMVKTDKRDAVALARLLAANIVPEVWVPPPHVRELRSLVAHRQRLVWKRATAKVRVRSVLQSNRLVGPKGMSAFDPDYWETLDVSSIDRLRALHAIADIDLVTAQIKEVEQELSRVSASQPWVNQVPYLIQLPGIGLTTAMTVLGAIGDVTRFPTARQLVGYAGLGARVYTSGLTHKTGGITKQGRSELRCAMVEAAWNAIKYSDLWRERFERLAYRIGRQKAAVAMARKLLVVVWHVLTEQAADREADPDAVARSMMLWGQRNRLAKSLGMTLAEFTRQKLDLLKLGYDVEQITFCSRVYALPPPAI